jgi:serine phosphatase RsbU (regulator of sigma subunit)
MVGAALALAVLGVLCLVDAALGEDVILTPLYGLAPLIACAVVPPAGTAVVAVLAVLAAVGSGAWNDTFGLAQHNVRVLNVALVSAAAVAIALVRVHRERRYQQMSAIAEAAQRAILPVLPRQAGEVLIAARYRSAAHGALVGGDLYDCYHSEAHIRLLIGDVRGKGITGVEQAARVIRAFRQSAALRNTLAEVAHEMDDYLAGFFGDEEFVTALLVEVSGPGELTLVDAGHPPPQLVGAGGGSEPVELPAGRPLGLGLGPAEYESTTIRWQPGDRMLMYTDGLSEARDAAGRFLAVGSLAPHLRDAGTLDSALDQLLDDVADHVPRGRLEDDLALVLLQNVGSVPAAPEPAEQQVTI